MKIMKYTIYCFAISLAIFSGCEKTQKHKEVPSDKYIHEEPVNAEYRGQVEGCIAHYDSLYCPDKYKPGTTASDKVEIISNENGSEVIINRKEK